MSKKGNNPNRPGLIPGSPLLWILVGFMIFHFGIEDNFLRLISASPPTSLISMGANYSLIAEIEHVDDLIHNADLPVLLTPMAGIFLIYMMSINGSPIIQLLFPPPRNIVFSK
jgi:hypothetical protein